MGWKNVKEHYRIVHAVQVTDNGICIGSPYIHDIIVISLDGVLTKREERSCNEELRRYMAEFDADPELLKQMVTTPDTFEKSLKVWTYDGGDIIEKRCEKYGYPNVTHDGEMMYENTFSKSRAKIVKEARENTEAGIRMAIERVAERRADLKEAEMRLAEYRENARKLESA